MKEQLISFETAKLAKEKGFELSSYYGYLPTGDITNYPEVGEYEKNYYAPTQSLLQKWLREVHNILVEVTINPGYGYWKVDWSLIRNLDSRVSYKSFSSLDKITGIKTYEKALEAGLQEALKLIK